MLIYFGTDRKHVNFRGSCFRMLAVILFQIFFVNFTKDTKDSNTYYYVPYIYS